jgi:mono/diheme cytochrome c family protein
MMEMSGNFLRFLRRFCEASLTILTLLIVPTASAQDDADDEEPFLPGLVANYRDAEGQSARRLDHQLAFHWGEAPPDPRLTAGEFRASWQGNLLTTSQGDYRFFVFGSGEIELRIAGRAVLPRQTVRNGWLSSPAVALTADHLPLELSFRRAVKDARLMVLWSGPDFGREPIPPRSLYHPREKPVEREFERGRLLARVLRCGRCHGEEQPSSLAPALDRLSGNVARDWLIRWLMAGEHAAEDRSPRRMPAFALSETQATALADWLLEPRQTDPSPAVPQEEAPERKKPKPDAKTGERLFVSLGCLACHSWRDLGASGWLGGGDLSHIADKRPPGFFAVWLSEPQHLNRDHRMPIFSLSNHERTSLALFLAEQKTRGERPASAGWSSPHKPASAGRSPARAEGRRVAEQFHCAACHRLPEAIRDPASRNAPRLDAHNNWDRSCLSSPDAMKHRPGYRLSKDDARAVRGYYVAARSVPRDGQFLLAEHNCLACHAREGTREAIPLLPPLLADKLTAVSKRYPDLAPQVPALTPPALTSVGDKLTDSALVEAVARRGGPHRPYLSVRMPRFPLSEEDLQTLVHHLTNTDRVPPCDATPAPIVDAAQRDRYMLAGGRLVSSDGFGCTSCHAVGRVQPVSDSLNSRGPDLLHLERRIRRPWFDRWVRNPARIVPRMEMPSVQIPVAGVLDGKLDDQLDAVWHVLNLPGFLPPLPNPIRTLRHSGEKREAEPLILTDILRHGERTRLKPFLVGLANRHNVLFNLESGGLAQWSIGDVARQHTRGKTWFWEPAGSVVLDNALARPDLSLMIDGRAQPAGSLDQFITEADAWRTERAGVCLTYRLKLVITTHTEGEVETAILHVRRKLTPLSTGFAQEIVVEGVPAGAKVRLDLLSAESAARATCSPDGRTLRLGDRFASRTVLSEPAEAKLAEEGRHLLLSADKQGVLRVVLHYLSEMPIDRFAEAPQTPAAAGKGELVEVAPGFSGERLPLPRDIMPTGLAWRPDARLVFCSLKGQVYEVLHTNGDDLEDRLQLLADGLPAPYGVHAEADYVDVSAKNALLRLHNRQQSTRRIEVIASGWGYSSDYHDWAVGLPRNERGEYFLGIPCQEDKRTPAAAHFHGNVLRLSPRNPTHDDPRLFTLAPISSGHRFPMGLALDRAGELFVTDNQGNYKPFNELNHVHAGAHFGFINYLDRGKPAPPRTPSAIDIPHPWTRSVNGICFLFTPKELRSKLGRDVFGPLEGHLIGCEYDTRRLIRMTLQRVGDTFQGAAYPLSIPPSDPQRGFLGPLVCGVSPRGELYVGSIRDSGWGAGANVGEIVRVRVHPDKLPCGLAELRATSDGFVLDFFRPIDRELAGRTESYTLQSYRREATPAYGGPDRDRRTEKIAGVCVSADGRRVTLRLAEMRPGFVYVLRLKNLAPIGGEFHPAEAHYTLAVVPK